MTGKKWSVRAIVGLAVWLLLPVVFTGAATGIASGAGLVQELRGCGLTDGGVGGVVTHVVDGDTLVLDQGRQVRLVGLQAPKLPLGRKDFEPWPLGDEAREALEKLTLGQKVRLFYGKTREDRHGRILAHIVIRQDTGVIGQDTGSRIWVQGQMLDQGLARVYSFADNRSCVEQMLTLERSARADRRGIWSNGFYTLKSESQSSAHLGTFQIIRGRVLDVAQVRTGVYLNFGENWRDDFTIFVAQRDLRRFGGKEHELELLEGQMILVRGWLKYRNGPMIEVSHPEQIEVVSD